MAKININIDDVEQLFRALQNLICEGCGTKGSIDDASWRWDSRNWMHKCETIGVTSIGCYGKGIVPGNRFNIIIDNCTQCKYIEIFSDPDPDDSFCYDDIGAFCKHPASGENDSYNPASKWRSDSINKRMITISARPHHLTGECKIPDWCPLLKK